MTNLQEGIPTRSHSVTVLGQTFNVLDHYQSVTPQLVEKEINDCPGFFRRLPEDFSGTFVDVGANVGIYSCLFSRLFPKAKIVAVEPVPDTFEIMLENFRANGVNAKAIKVAVTGSGSTSVLGFNALNSGGASTQVAGLAPETFVVPATRLEDLLNQVGVGTSKDAVLKLDVEGAEYGILYGVKDWKRFKMINVELHGILNMPNEINQAVMDTLDTFLCGIAFANDVEIDIRWPHEFRPRIPLGYDASAHVKRAQ